MAGSTQKYIVSSEPVVVPNEKDWLTDEALYEFITVSTEAKTQKHLMCILIEVKEEKKYPYKLSRRVYNTLHLSSLGSCNITLIAIRRSVRVAAILLL